MSQPPLISKSDQHPEQKTESTGSEGYRGRFAPSPTGHLHIGSLIGALASYLDAKANNGKWLIRVEDLDPPREIAGAAQSILTSLNAHGLYSDEDVVWQSQRRAHYQRALTQLLAQGDAFYCQCSRADIQKTGNIHSGKCQSAVSNDTDTANKIDTAIRVHVGNIVINFDDTIQGTCGQQLNSETGDFVIQRKDGLFAYQLAVVVDDALQRITHVVRGSDLLDSTPRQIYLQHLLKLSPINYSHFPVITNKQRQKLSKQTFAKPLSNNRANENIIRALDFLQQPTPDDGFKMKAEELLSWAIEHWSIELIPRQRSIIERESTQT